ncbi:MAG: translation initiation factor IF-3 [Microgenomates group bacterium]
MGRKFYRLNQYITAKEVRVVDEKGKQIGIFPIEEALNKARSLNLDLVEVAPQANPPVCKIIDFKKFKYLEKKKEKEEKKKNKKIEVKEIRLKPFIAENDLNFRIKKAEKFLKEGNKVKLVVTFYGRQLGKQNFGREIINKIIENLSFCSKPEGEMKILENRIEVILGPLK